LKDRLDALAAIQSQIKQVQEKSEEGQKAMTLDTTIGFAETTSFEIKKAEFTPASSGDGPGNYAWFV
jgi:singapore isolate B (sub-type 7) whole genome shotgun sequence assembly, scaffold_0